MKYSFKNDTTKSSVIVLRDGRALEIRRGEKTSFTKEERQTWPSLDAWMGTLPDGASVKVSKGKPVGKPRPVVTNPVLARFLERVRSSLRAGDSIPLKTMDYHGTRAHVIHTRKINRWYGIDGWSLAQYDAKIAEIATRGVGDLPVFCRRSWGSRYVTLTPDGELRNVYYNRAHNAIGYFLERAGHYWEDRHLGENFVELTDPEMPLWLIMDGRHVKV